jgi:hypothetical protein
MTWSTHDMASRKKHQIEENMSAWNTQKRATSFGDDENVSPENIL